VLRYRVLTAVLLAPLVLWIVWLAPEGLLPPAFAAVALLGAWEWAQFMGLRQAVARFAYVAVIAAAIAVSWIYLRAGWPSLPVILSAVAWWVFVFVWLYRFSKQPTAVEPPPWVTAVIGLVTLVPAWFAVVQMHRVGGAEGAYWVTLLLVLVWGSDVAAYFAGKAFGRHKLAPRLSPGKTWEGAAGGMIIGLLLAGGFHWAASAVGIGPERVNWYLLLPVAAATIVFGIVGDLFESMLKRRCGVKDSGGILPGHGGILDRIDALVAAAPVLAIGLLAGT
jgi:phosphatidate cytidylyltransferase